MELDTLGSRLNWARRNVARITQQELRSRMATCYGVEVGRNYISEIEKERAKKRPSFEVIRAMAGALGISLDYLALFTDQWQFNPDKETSPHYMSPEADEVASIVDSLSREHRGMILNLAHSLAASPVNRQRREDLAMSALDSIEHKWGREVRDDIEHILRNRGMVNDTP